MFAPGSLSDPYRLYEFNGVLPETTLSMRGRVPVSLAMADERTAVIVLLGQSNAQNGIPGTYTVANTKNENFCISNGGLYRSLDPLLGCPGLDGCVLTRIADLLINDDVYDRVIGVPFAIGGTKVSDWAPGGGVNHRIVAACNRLANAALSPTFILWHQGEQDAIDNSISSAAYAASLREVVATFRAGGVDAPFLVAKDTWYQSNTATNAANIRAGQAAALSDGLGIFAGPDTDTLNDTYRLDGTHFTAAGGDAHAALWNTAIQNYLDTH